MNDVDDAIARAEAGTAGQQVSQVIADRILLAAEVRRLRGELNERLRRLEQRAQTFAAIPVVAHALAVLDDREEDDENEHRG